MTPRFTNWLIAALAVALFLPAVAGASWNSNGPGNGFGKADSVAAGNTPTASVSNRSVTVNWGATGGSVPVTGYVVKRYSTGGAQQTIGANCSGIVTGTSCTEDSVPAGNWRYTVTPARQNWRGNESGQSTAVTVNAPAMTLSPTSVTSLPQTLTGQITNFVPGQTVTFGLDQATGQPLTGSITPSPVPANGTANVSVTLPNGTSNGSHTIYAVGSGPDVASANITVAVASTITTSAYDWRDASAGGAEANQSQQLAFASDARTVTTGSWPATFSTSRYLDVNLNSPLRGASQVASGTINVRLASNTSTNACFYVEARKASDNSVVATYGSSGSPFCTTSGSTQTNFSIPIGAATTGAIANDLRFRIYGRTNTLGGAWTLDQVSLSVTGGDGSFTLYPNAYSDASTGTAIAVPWSLALDDNSFYNNAATGNWQTAYSATRYLKATFPAYVPSGATVQSVTLTHVYRPLSASRQVCHRVEVLNGAMVIGTHGSTTSGFSCNSNSTTDLTDSIALPEVNTVAEANSLAVRLHMWRSAAGTTQSRTDQIRLSISYVK